MVQIKPADADRFLARPDPAVRVILIFGNDEGLVSERAARFAAAVLGESGDPFARVRLDAATIADDPGRLADEANAVPLFGGQRVITVGLSGARSIQPAVEALLAAPPVDSWVVIAAGDQRKGSGLRKLCETHERAAAIACYADSDRDLDRIIDEETRKSGLTITTEARTALKAMLGADRMASRSEVAKLCLYAADTGTITIDDVRAIIGDAAASAVDEAIDDAALGDAAGLDRVYRRSARRRHSRRRDRRRRPAPFQLSAEGACRLRRRRCARGDGRPRQPAGLLSAAQCRHPPVDHMERGGARGRPHPSRCGAVRQPPPWRDRR